MQYSPGKNINKPYKCLLNVNDQFQMINESKKILTSWMFPYTQSILYGNIHTYNILDAFKNVNKFNATYIAKKSQT